METHEIKTEKGEFVVVDRKDDLPILTFISNMYDLGLRKYICKLSEATEEDAKGVVDMYNIGNFNILSYKPSLEYLLTSKGIDINNGNWYLFKKV